MAWKMSVTVQPGGCSSAYRVPCLLAEGVGFLRGKPRATVMVCLKTPAICLISVEVPCYFMPVLDTNSWELPWQVDIAGLLRDLLSRYSNARLGWFLYIHLLCVAQGSRENGRSF